MSTASQPTEAVRAWGRRGGLKDGERRRTDLEQQIAGMTSLEIYRYGYTAGYRASRRPPKGDAQRPRGEEVSE